MIDLHIHTTFSDGRKTLEEVLHEAEDLGLKAISITDHDRVDAYKVLENPKIREIFNGKIIPGVEISTVVDGTYVHILGYGIEYRQIEDKMNRTADENMKLMLEMIKRKIDSFGFDLDISKNSILEMQRQIVSLVEDQPNKFPIPIDLTTRTDGMSKGNVLWWQHLSNKNSILHVDYSDMYYNVDEVIHMIRSCGGVAVLAHPAQYYGDKENVINALIGKIDGIECYHYSATPEYREHLIETCRENGLLVTGSDYHGLSNPPGSQNVPDELSEQFVARGIKSI